MPRRRGGGVVTSDNRLLAALSARAFARVSPFLDVILMTLKTVLDKPTAAVSNRCHASVTADLVRIHLARRDDLIQVVGQVAQP